MFGARSTYAPSNILVANLRQNMHFLYLQDDWRVNDQLTLNISTPTMASAPTISRITTRPASLSTCQSDRAAIPRRRVAAAQCDRRRMADRRRQQRLRRGDGHTHLYARHGVSSLGDSAGFPRRQQPSAQHHRRGGRAGDQRDVQHWFNRNNVVIQLIRASRSATRRATPIAGRWCGSSIWWSRSAAVRQSNFEFRAEFFNFFNRTNFRAPNGNRSSAAFGTISPLTTRGSSSSG